VSAQRALTVAAVIAAAVMLGVLAYLYVFGTLLGYQVSGFSGDGPYWPMTVVFVSGTAFVLALLAKAGVGAAHKFSASRQSQS